MTEARLAQGKDGWLEPEGEGWYVLNAQDAKWLSNEMGWYCNFEGAAGFPEFGFNLNRLPPGAPSEASARFGRLETSTYPGGLLPGERPVGRACPARTFCRANEVS